MPTPRRKPQQAVNLEATMNDSIVRQDRARQTRSYNVIGRLYTLETEVGRVQFDRQRGPGIAQELDANGDFTGQLLFVGAWEKLPAIKEYSEDFCPACLQMCDVCDGKGKSLCILVGCGGRGSVPDGEDDCPACVVVSGKFDPSCTVCGGYGALKKTRPCPSCHGSGQAVCAPCRGTGKRPTGKSDNKLCPECQGSQRGGKFIQQDLSKVIAGKIASYFAIGPVRKMIIVPFTSADSTERFAARWESGDQKTSQAFIRISPERDDSGQSMLVLLPMNASGEGVMPYLFGGSVL